MIKKKHIIVVIVLAIAVIAGACLVARPKVLGNMGNRYAEPTTATSDVSFEGKAGDKIKFSFSSDIESGNLDIILYDSKGNEVYTLDKAKKLETFFDLAGSDTYTLAAECGDFVGNYKIEICKAN